MAERWGNGILRPGVILAFDDPDLGAIPVADVLADPRRYDGETLADPIEGVDISALLDGDYESELRSLTGVMDYRDALGVLAPLPTAELERLFAVIARSFAPKQSSANPLAKKRSRRARTSRRRSAHG